MRAPDEQHPAPNHQPEQAYEAREDFFLLSVANFLNAQILSPNTNLTAREEQIIAAAKPGAAPHFNGAMIVGGRPARRFCIRWPSVVNGP